MQIAELCDRARDVAAARDPFVTWSIGAPAGGGRIGRGVPSFDAAIAIARDEWGDALEPVPPLRDETPDSQIVIDGQVIRFFVFKVRGLDGAGAIMPELRCACCRRTL